MSMENNNEQSSMEIFEKDQKIAFVDSFSDAALSYEYEQAGFTINLMNALFFSLTII
jgi:DNA-dependent RNA polymerase auxiliary subunit epsilon